jgi:transcriptional regulator with XRE-family HTH domain
MAIDSPPMNTSPPLYDFVMAELRAKRIPQRRIARESGVPFSTVCKIAQGSVKEPSVHTIQRLADYFRGVPAVASEEPARQVRAAAAGRRQADRLTETLDIGGRRTGWRRGPEIISAAESLQQSLDIDPAA